MEKNYKRGVTPNFSIEIIDLKSRIIELNYFKNRYEVIENVKNYKEKYNPEYRIKMYILKKGKWCLFESEALKDIKI